MIYRLILPGRMSVGVSSRWGKNVFSFVGNVKISVSESDQNDVQEGEERGKIISGKWGFKCSVVSGSLENCSEESFVISLFSCGLSIAAPLVLFFFTAFWEEGMALEVVLVE